MIRAFGLALCATLFAAAGVQAQESTLAAGTLKGTIVSVDGVPLSFARVELRNTEFTTQTDSDGTYALNGVPPGDYTLRISLLGYVPVEQALTVPPGKALLIDARLRLEPGGGMARDPQLWSAAGEAKRDRYAEAARAAGQVPFALLDGNTAFALDLYRELASTDPGNLAVSPLSLSTLLAAVQLGARGQAATEIGRVLRHFLPATELLPALAALQDYLNAAGDVGAVTLRSGWGLWTERSTALTPEYAAHLERLGARAEPLDFAGAPEASRETVNRWIAETTEGAVRDLFPSGSVTPETRVLLAQALSFTGDWMTPFPRSDTAPQPFWVAPDSAIQVPTMRMTGTVRHGATEDAEVVELPYRGDLVSMLLILPRERDGLAALEAALTPERLREYLAALRPGQASVHLPRFRVRWEASLQPALERLGMPAPFTAAADLSGMAGGALFLEDLRHAAVVETDEAGSRAHAVTAAPVAESSDTPPPVFTADRPFLFLIRDQATGSILFMGRVKNPS